jgi:riboflavin kinase/FMN adenylyltransferase
MYNGRAVSSTWLRELIKGGQLDMAAKFLRRPVSVLGTVVAGDKRGSALGTPTANIDPHHEVLPPPSVYAVKARHTGSFHDGIMNIGYKPTFYGDRLEKRREPVIETHLFDFKGDLYGSDLEIYFIEKIRDELWFENVSQLRGQISKDLQFARKILSDKDRIKKTYLNRVK